MKKPHVMFESSYTDHTHFHTHHDVTDDVKVNNMSKKVKMKNSYCLLDKISHDNKTCIMINKEIYNVK